jgi:hypothetical protein
VRERYIQWEAEILQLLHSVDVDIDHTIELTNELLATSNGLNVKRAPAQNVELLASVHGNLEAQILRSNLLHTNAMFYIGQNYLSTQLNQSNIVDPTVIKSELEQSLGREIDLSLKPLVGDVRPSGVCSSLINQNCDDQMGITTEVSLDDSVATILFIFDCSANGNSWSLVAARRVFACKGVYLDVEVKRGVEKKLTADMAAKSDIHFASPIPLPTQNGTTFTAVGAAITGCFVALLNATSSVPGYIPQPISVISPDAYQLPAERDVAITLSASACAAQIAGIIKQYEDDPNNQGFLHERFFDKFLDKNVTVNFSPDEHALLFYVMVMAKYQDTTLGKDWNVDIYCRLPVRCTFQSSYVGRDLSVEVNVKSTGDLEVLSHKINCGVICDILDYITPIVDNKIRDIQNDHRFSIDSTLPFAVISNAKGSDPIVKANLLIFEINYIAASA